MTLEGLNQYWYSSIDLYYRNHCNITMPGNDHHHFVLTVLAFNLYLGR